MTTVKFISRLLKMKGFRAKHFWFTMNTLDIIVRPWKNGCQCPECGRKGRIVRVMKERRIWKDIRICQWQVQFFYSPKEIICPIHGRIQEMIPWAQPHSRVTRRLEYQVLRLASCMPQSDGAKLLDMSKSTFSDILHRAIKREREGHRIRGLKVIGIDEISYCKGRKFATVVYDLDKSKVIWIGKGKARDTIDRFFEEELSPHQRNGIKFGVCDMSPTYTNAIKEYCPNAVLILDRFHIAKALNEAMDEVRKEQWRELSQKDKKRKVLKGIRWAMFRHSKNRSKKDEKSLTLLKRINYRIYRAWLLKDEFEQIWTFENREQARDFGLGWIKRVNRSRLPSMKKFAKTLYDNIEHVIAFIGPELTNAIAEGINRIIRMIKNRASGFPSLDAFCDLIFLVIGDVDIAGAIPAKHRTI